MNTKIPECYTTDPHARCLHVEASPGRSYFLPLNQFAFCDLKSDDKEQVLLISFATHEIMVRGKTFRRIENAIHQLELSFLTAIPAKYHPLIPEGQPAIREIVVTEMKNATEQSQLN
jgi:hypothetical protein